MAAACSFAVVLFSRAPACGSEPGGDAAEAPAAAGTVTGTGAETSKDMSMPYPTTCARAVGAPRAALPRWPLMRPLLAPASQGHGHPAALAALAAIL